MPSCVKQTMNSQAGVDINQFSALFKSTLHSLHCVIHSLTAYNPLLDFFLFEQLIDTGNTVLTDIFCLPSVLFVEIDKYKSELLQCSTHTCTHSEPGSYTAGNHHKEVKIQHFNLTLMAATVVTLMRRSEEEFWKVDSGSRSKNARSYKTSLGRIWLAWLSALSVWK